MSVDVDVQYAVPQDEADNEPPPGAEQIRRWVGRALEGRRQVAELTVRIVGRGEITQLNRDFRHKNTATNVLSFPFESHDMVQLPLLGDVVICADVVTEEARQQHKALEAHWAHMVVHGVLHLLGYDHLDEREAEQMESLETAVLAHLGFPDPYVEVHV